MRLAWTGPPALLALLASLNLKVLLNATWKVESLLYLAFVSHLNKVLTVILQVTWSVILSWSLHKN